MESQNKPSLYSVKVLNWVEKFALKHSLFNSKKGLIVAVSGGVDSIALAEVLARLQQRSAITHELSLLHIDHQTRSQSEHRADLDCVIELADKYELDLHFETVKTRTKQEHVLREARESIYKRYAARYNSQIVTGHHVDDSFEWSLMQSFKTSDPNKTLGIPLKRSPMIRPFLCLTKANIEKFAELEKLNFQADKTNDDVCYERNYLRSEIIPKIKERFPQYLKHYVNQKNELVSRSQKTQRIVVKDDSITIEIKNQERNLNSYRPEIRAAIHKLSTKKRGSIAGQLDSLVQAYTNYKKGPVSFSGGVHAHLKKNKIVLTRSKLSQ